MMTSMRERDAANPKHPRNDKEACFPFGKQASF